mmetsp:Transcript_11286/g.34781  ORF Transcript_11286/g.34781 Transcript_11286/m.34781 type:complete len:98 (-) Transcript_11286:442-735(-)
MGAVAGAHIALFHAALAVWVDDSLGIQPALAQARPTQGEEIELGSARSDVGAAVSTGLVHTQADEDPQHVSVSDRLSETIRSIFAPATLTLKTKKGE